MMNNFEERLASVRKGIMKRAAAMKEKAKKQGFEFKPFSRKQKQVLTWWCPSSPVIFHCLSRLRKDTGACM